MTKPQFNFVGIVVANMAASLAFYRRLGVDVPEGADDEVHAQVTFDNGMTLAWDTLELVKSIDPEWTTPAGSPRMAVALQCSSPAEVDRVFADMAEAGYEGLPPWNAEWGQRYASLLDPDGNGVDLYAWLPDSAPGS